MDLQSITGKQPINPTYPYFEAYAYGHNGKKLSLTKQEFDGSGNKPPNIFNAAKDGSGRKAPILPYPKIIKKRRLPWRIQCKVYGKPEGCLEEFYCHNQQNMQAHTYRNFFPDQSTMAITGIRLPQIQ